MLKQQQDTAQGRDKQDSCSTQNLGVREAGFIVDRLPHDIQHSSLTRKGTAGSSSFASSSSMSPSSLDPDSDDDEVRMKGNPSWRKSFRDKVPSYKRKPDVSDLFDAELRKRRSGRGESSQSSSNKEGKQKGVKSPHDLSSPGCPLPRNSRNLHAVSDDLDTILEAQRLEDTGAPSSDPTVSPKRKREVISDSDYRLRKERTDNLVKGLRQVRERSLSPSRQSSVAGVEIECTILKQQQDTAQGRDKQGSCSTQNLGVREAGFTVDRLPHDIPHRRLMNEDHERTIRQQQESSNMFMDNFHESSDVNNNNDDDVDNDRGMKRSVESLDQVTLTKNRNEPLIEIGDQVTFDDTNARVASVGNITAIVKVEKDEPSSKDDIWYHKIDSSSNTHSRSLRNPWDRNDNGKPSLFVDFKGKNTKFTTAMVLVKMKTIAEDVPRIAMDSDSDVLSSLDNDDVLDQKSIAKRSEVGVTNSRSPKCIRRSSATCSEKKNNLNCNDRVSKKRKKMEAVEETLKDLEWLLVAVAPSAAPVASAMNQHLPSRHQIVPQPQQQQQVVPFPSSHYGGQQATPATSEAESDKKVNANLLLAMEVGINVDTPQARKLLFNPCADLDVVILELSAISNTRSVKDGKAVLWQEIDALVQSVNDKFINNNPALQPFCVETMAIDDMEVMAKNMSHKQRDFMQRDVSGYVGKLRD
jgi:hypothetical protein